VDKHSDMKNMGTGSSDEVQRSVMFVPLLLSRPNYTYS